MLLHRHYFMNYEIMWPRENYIIFYDIIILQHEYVSIVKDLMTYVDM